MFELGLDQELIYADHLGDWHKPTGWPDHQAGPDGDPDLLDQRQLVLLRLEISGRWQAMRHPGDHHTGETFF